ncbi:hypothetical protein ABT160_12380 [Streptomyces sp. NPDC001941]|uniref:vWA domain-containing protein n=1 Tax=Streptomyces sp. NPDC001941 TaxID=3154659 RepID=UPI00331EDC5C
MPNSPSLILNGGRRLRRAEVDRLEGLPPNFAVVYPVEGGPWEVETAKDRTLARRVFGGNRVCYLVDMGVQVRTASTTRTPVPCRDQAHVFETTLHITYRVDDPVTVVQRNVPDLSHAVYQYLIGQIMPVAAGYAIGEAFEVQARVNAMLAGPVSVPGGVCVESCRADMRPDTAARDFTRTVASTHNAHQLGSLRHHGAVGAVRHEVEIENLRQAGELARREKEIAALGNLDLDFRGLITVHLSQHPQDTERAMQMLMQWETARHQHAYDQEQRQIDMVRYMMDKGIIREVDLPGLREGVLGGAAGLVGGLTGAAGALPAGGTPQAAAGPPLAPLAQQSAPAAPPTVTWGGTPPAGAAGARAASGTVIAPVYVALDASLAASGHLDQLRDCVLSLRGKLLGMPGLASVVRLSVLTYADEARVAVPLTQVEWSTGTPDLQQGGACRWAPLFRRLGELLPLEVERLKEQVDRVIRPTVFLLSVGQPEDGDAWPDAYRALMELRYRPTIASCAVGRADRRAVRRVAAHPELACAAPPDAVLAESVLQFSALLQQTVAQLATDVVAGGRELRLDRPQGLLRIEEPE